MSRRCNKMLTEATWRGRVCLRLRMQSATARQAWQQQWLAVFHGTCWSNPTAPPPPLPHTLPRVSGECAASAALLLQGASTLALTSLSRTLHHRGSLWLWRNLLQSHDYGCWAGMAKTFLWGKKRKTLGNKHRNVNPNSNKAPLHTH